MNILFVNACVRPQSRTRKLAQAVLDRLSGSITEVDLNAEKIKPMDLDILEKRNALGESGEFSDPIFAYAKTFAEADTVVIAAPYWDLSFPASLKAYLEAVTVLGVTFRYSPEGFPVSLCRANKLVYVATSGGPMKGMNYGYEYVKALASAFFGIKEFGFYCAENLDVVGVDAEAVLSKAIYTINNEAIAEHE